MIGALSFLLRLIFVFLVVRVLGLAFRAFFKGLRVGMSSRRSSRAEGGGGTGPPVQIEEMLLDPVCGAHVAERAAFRGSFRGRDAAFCSVACAGQAARAMSGEPPSTESERAAREF
jgi:YHS domain-containing protein